MINQRLLSVKEEPFEIMSSPVFNDVRHIPVRAQPQMQARHQYVI